ncbi:MAG: PadR family transcriptional regulator [Candidatus Altiarchaeota archaeon]
MDNPPLRRLRDKTTIEVLWIYILSLMKDEPLYAYEIKERIEDKYGFEIGKVTAYMVLYRLEYEGYVETEWRVIENRQRKYYRITESGRETLDEGVKYVKGLAEELEH